MRHFLSSRGVPSSREDTACSRTCSNPSTWLRWTEWPRYARRHYCKAPAEPLPGPEIMALVTQNCVGSRLCVCGCVRVAPFEALKGTVTMGVGTGRAAGSRGRAAAAVHRELDLANLSPCVCRAAHLDPAGTCATRCTDRREPVLRPLQPIRLHFMPAE